MEAGTTARPERDLRRKYTVAEAVSESETQLRVLQGFCYLRDNQAAARLLPGILFFVPSETTKYVFCRANRETGATGLEPATSGVTGRRSNQLNYAPGDGPV